MSKSAGKKPKEKNDKTKADNFVWTDDEVQLLLEVTNDYKVSKAAKNIAIKGGGRPTRLLPHAKMLLIPIKFFLSAG